MYQGQVVDFRTDNINIFLVNFYVFRMFRLPVSVYQLDYFGDLQVAILYSVTETDRPYSTVLSLFYRTALSKMTGLSVFLKGRNIRTIRSSVKVLWLKTPLKK